MSVNKTIQVKASSVINLWPPLPLWGTRSWLVIRKGLASKSKFTSQCWKGIAGPPCRTCQDTSSDARGMNTDSRKGVKMGQGGMSTGKVWQGRERGCWWEGAEELPAACPQAAAQQPFSGWDHSPCFYWLSIRAACFLCHCAPYSICVHMHVPIAHKTNPKSIHILGSGLTAQDTQDVDMDKVMGRRPKNVSMYLNHCKHVCMFH